MGRNYIGKKGLGVSSARFIGKKIAKFPVGRVGKKIAFGVGKKIATRALDQAIQNSFR